MKFLRLTFLTICLALTYVPSAAQSRRVADSFDTSPFNAQVEKLPRGYPGHSVITLSQALPSWKRAAEKSEFETTADYRERLSMHKRITLIGMLRFDSLLAFTISGERGVQFTASYDADLGIMTVTIKMLRDYSAGSYDNPYYKLFWGSTRRQLGTYIGRNVFNRSARVQVYRDEYFYLGMTGSNLETFAEFRPSNGEDNSAGYRSVRKIYDPIKTLNVALHMGANEARAVKPNLRALIIGRLAEDPYYYSSGRDTPEIDDPNDIYEHTHIVKVVPQEIWIYNIVSGIIYTRITPTPDDSARSTESATVPLTTTTEESVQTTEAAASPQTIQPNPKSSPQTPSSETLLNGKAISLPRPEYPKKAKAARASGTVTVQVTIDETGKVIFARAVGGHPLLVEAAVQAAYMARFTPTIKDGQPVRVIGSITYTFIAN